MHLLRKIATVDPNALVSFIQTIDVSTLNISAPQFPRASPTDLMDTDGVIDPQDLITLLEHNPAAIVSVIDGLFFPNKDVKAASSQSVVEICQNLKAPQENAVVAGEPTSKWCLHRRFESSR